MISSGAGAGGSDGGSGSSSNGGPTRVSSNGGGLLKKGPWTAAEDEVLIQYVRNHGEGNWNAVQKQSGLNRCGKSCRLRWANHLRPNLKKGSFTQDEERLILELHAKYGNKWARMASHLPGRTDNEIKNYWNTRVKRRKRQGLPLYPNDIHQQVILNSPTSLTSTTPTPPTTPTNPNFPFQPSQQHIPFQTSPTSFDHHHHQTALPFSFQYRPVPLLAAPSALSRGGFKPPPYPSPQQAQFVHFCGPTGGSAGFDSASPVKTELPSNQYHQNVIVTTPHSQRNLHGGGSNLEDILDNLLDEAHISIEGSSEFLPKEEPKEHINSLPEDLSKLLNFAPTSTATASTALHPDPMGPPHHWYSHGGSGEISSSHSEDAMGLDMQHLVSFFPVASPSTTTTPTSTSTTDYNSQNPASWDTLPGIGKGWSKHM